MIYYYGVLSVIGAFLFSHLILRKHQQLLPPTLSYYFFTTSYFLQGFVATLLVILLWPFMYDTDDPQYLPRLVVIRLLKIPQSLGLRVVVRGKPNDFSTSPVVFVANHQSVLDLIPTYLSTPQRTVIVGKQELKYAGTFGLSSMLCGAVFVERHNPRNSHDTMQKLADRIQAENLNVWMFAEGTRNRQENGQLLPFKKGAFHLALQAGVPVVPVVISSYASFYHRKRKIFCTGGKVIVQFLPPVDSKDYSVDTVGQFTQNVHGAMAVEFTKVSEEAATT